MMLEVVWFPLATFVHFMPMKLYLIIVIVASAEEENSGKTD
jgi:hypothetical protein